MKKSVEKRISYQGLEQDPRPQQIVAYRRYGKQIVFTAVHKGTEGAGSSINFAEEIVAAISQAEGINPRRCHFYDLQTQKGYDSHRPGEFTFSELHFRWGKKPRPASVWWIDGHPAEKVLRDFAQYIWGEHPRGNHRNLAVAHGRLKTLPRQPKLLK